MFRRSDLLVPEFWQRNEIFEALGRKKKHSAAQFSALLSCLRSVQVRSYNSDLLIQEILDILMDTINGCVTSSLSERRAFGDRSWSLQIDRYAESEPEISREITTPEATVTLWNRRIAFVFCQPLLVDDSRGSQPDSECIPRVWHSKNGLVRSYVDFQKDKMDYCSDEASGRRSDLWQNFPRSQYISYDQESRLEATPGIAGDVTPLYSRSSPLSNFSQ